MSAEQAAKWAASVEWSAMSACLLFGRESAGIAAARVHTDIPIHVYDPGGGEPAAPGVSIHSDLDNYRRAVMRIASQDVAAAAFACESEQDRLGDDEFHRWEQALGSTFESAEVERNTEARFGERWAYCVIETLKRARGALLVGGNLGCIKGVPTVVAGAGPGLDANGAELAAWKGRGIVVASLTAVKPLRRHGVTPDIVIASDANPILYDLAESLGGLEEMVLLGGMHVDPRLWDLPWRDRMLAIHAVSGAGPWLANRLDISMTPIAGTVTGMGVGAALQWGSRPIVLVGQDLAWGTEESLTHHADGGGAVADNAVTIRADMYGQQAIFHGEKLHAPVTTVKGWGGGEVVSSRLFDHYRRWFVEAAGEAHKADPNYQLINATESGSHIEGWRHIPLRRIVPKAPAPWGSMLDGRRLTVEAADDALAEIARTADQLAVEAAESARLHQEYLDSQERVEQAARACIVGMLASKTTIRRERDRGARTADQQGTISKCVDAVESGARAVAMMARGETDGDDRSAAA